MLRNMFFAVALLGLATPALAETTQGADGDGNSSVAYNPETGEFSVQPDGQAIGLFDIQSASGIFTASANLPGNPLFQENTANRKSWAALPASAINAAHGLGVICAPGLGLSFLLSDLTLTGSGGFGTSNRPLDLVYLGGAVGTPGFEWTVGGSVVPNTGGSLAFGQFILQGQLAEQTITISNTGDAELTLGEPSITGGPFSIVGTVPTSVAAGGMAELVLALSTADQGSFTGNLAIATNAGDVALDLSGRVIPEPSSIALFGLALVGLVGAVRRRK